MTDLGEGPGEEGEADPLFYIQKKKSQKEERPAGQAKQNHPPTFVPHRRSICSQSYGSISLCLIIADEFFRLHNLVCMCVCVCVCVCFFFYKNDESLH